MKSSDLNERLRAVADDVDGIEYESFGGKVVPYIGWYWREVDFDADTCSDFGVLPVTYGIDANDTPRIGFMANNKWGYEQVAADAAQFKAIKEALVTAVMSGLAGDFERADRLVQALMPVKAP